MTCEEIEKVAIEQQKWDEMKQEEIGGNESSSGEEKEPLDISNNEGVSTAGDEKKLESSKGVGSVNVEARSDKVKSGESIEGNDKKHEENDDNSETMEKEKIKPFLHDVNQKLYLLENLIADYKLKNEKMRRETQELQSTAESAVLKKNDETIELEETTQDEKNVKELKIQMDKLIKEKGQVDELVQELGEVIKQSNCAINEYKQDNEDLCQKVWKAICKTQSRDKELDEKQSELESACKAIDELADRLKELGEDLQENKEEE